MSCAAVCHACAWSVLQLSSTDLPSSRSQPKTLLSADRRLILTGEHVDIATLPGCPQQLYRPSDPPTVQALRHHGDNGVPLSLKSV
ncbi:hypothetical protein BRADI_3g30718v3 [Brachypodium distachyon]|uniref:Uncharacterized protein n=1 Tax=Brachypodium distachyon TaxID=15368 RepID=A0A0Q3FH51_BRADI|nr:hypothetical protein BRADI_3g30718v3 [Brachypodium distachyon]PNT67699.1 hypothetical protein BRADI_3g30718v3 [Brachypodium distachyon]PNT67700.1 hypothetical protein BRADI_3g30718v3 [Brachypodium distachyon]